MKQSTAENIQYILAMLLIIVCVAVIGFGLIFHRIENKLDIITCQQNKPDSTCTIK